MVKYLIHSIYNIPSKARTVYLALGMLLLVVTCHSCNNSKADVSIAHGDLLFQLCQGSDFSDAILEATSPHEGLAFSHVGIFAMVEGDSMVIEANTQGVRLTPLHDFMTECPGVVAMRVKAPISVDKAVERALSYVGLEYDWEFDADNDKLYCSELVQVSYLDDEGAPIFESIPMNFKDESGEIPQFWTDLFESLGRPIPQGEPGTNPNSIFASPWLVPVMLQEGHVTGGTGYFVTFLLMLQEGQDTLLQEGQDTL